jgi:GTPase SAR1 family protein
MGKFGKRNNVNLDILSYNIMLLGESGSGKTSLINNVVTKYTGDPDAALFLEIGMERGADAISNINYINCPEWTMDEYDELDNAAGFYDVCEDIIENKSEYPKLRAVVWDTLDQLINIAESRVIEMWNKECRMAGHPEKVAKTINGCYSGYGRGEKKAIEMILDVMNRLRRVGVATIIIGHVKNKQVDDVFTGKSYQILTSDQQQNYFNAVKKNIHVLGLLYIDRELAAEKTGRKVFGTNKDETVSHVIGETRKVRFRDDGAVVDCKSRFANIVPEIDCDADQFIKAIEDAIKAEQSKSGMSLDEAKKQQEKHDKAMEQRIEENEKRAKHKKELDSVVSDIVKFFSDNKSNIDNVKPVLAAIKKGGYSNPREIDDIEFARSILAMTQEK